MAEPMENPVIVIPIKFVSLNLGRPAAGHRSPGSDGWSRRRIGRQTPPSAPMEHARKRCPLPCNRGSGIDGDAPILREDAARDAGCGRPIISHHPPITPEGRHAALVEECPDEADATFGGSGGKRFGASPLKVRAMIFTMLIADKLVVKLPGSAWRRMPPPASGSALIRVTVDS